MSETAFVTLLFTDLVGSTELSQRLGEDAAEVLRSEHTEVLRDAIDGSAGREVKHLGDGIMAVFTSPSEAVRCAIAMQQGVDKHNRRLPEALGLRIGLHVGEVTVKDGDYFGTAVVVAERLCKRADGGQIFTSDVVRSVVGTRGGHTFKELGPLELKGIDGPIPAYELHWEPLREESTPLPGLFRSIERLFFVGRGEEYERLARAWKLAASGDRQVTLLSGEPGIGKTRLCTEIAFDVYESGGHVLYGRCDEDPVVPYQPFAEALDHLLQHAPLEFLAEHVRRHGGELARIAPGLLERVPDAPPPITTESADPQADREAERYRLFEAAAALIRSATDHTPVLMVLDDLHWATRPTLLLLRRILRDTENLKLMVVGTYRDTDLARTHPLSEMLADWRRELECERVALSGLDADGVLRYIEAAAGDQHGSELEALARAVHAETEGNPFFMGQVLRHLAETRVLYQEDGRWTYDGSVEQLGIPEGVRDVVGRRLSRLSESTNRALSVAAVFGGEFEVDALEHVLGADVLDALDEASAARVIVEVPDAPGSYRFTHTLVKQTLYEELSSARRTRLHQKAGEALETLKDTDAVLPSLARHFAEGARAGSVAKAGDYSIRAAQEALSRAAYEEAIAHAERGLQVLDLDDDAHAAERADLWLAIAQSHAMLLDSDGCCDAAERAAGFALDATEPETLTRAVQWFGIMSTFTRRAGEAPGLADRALTVVTDEYPGLQAVVLGTKVWCQADTAPAAATLDTADEAIALARRSGDDLAKTWVLGLKGYLCRDFIDNETLLEIAREAGEAATAIDDQFLLATGVRIRRCVHLSMGDRASFEADGAEVGRIGEPLRMGILGAVALGTRATSAMFDGRFEEAAGYADEYISTWRSAPLLFTYTVRMMGIRWDQGRLTDAETLASGLLRAMQRRGRFAVVAEAFVTACKASRGDQEAARQRLPSLAAEAASGISPLTCASLVAEVCAEVGDADSAAVLLPVLSPRHRMLPVIGDGWLPTGAVDRYVAMLATTIGDYDEAEQRFEVALEFEESIPAASYAARTRYWYARMLKARNGPGDVERADKLLDTCTENAHAFGMAHLEEQALELRA